MIIDFEESEIQEILSNYFGFKNDKTFFEARYDNGGIFLELQVDNEELKKLKKK